MIGGATGFMEVACRPLHWGGLGILQLQNMNLALLTKYATKIMSHAEELALKVLWDNYLH